MKRAARFGEQRLSGNPRRISKAESKGSGIPKDSKPETGPSIQTSSKSGVLDGGRYMTGHDITAAWEAVGTLDRAAEYILEDAGARDIDWNQDLQDARELIHKYALALRRRIMRRTL